MRIAICDDDERIINQIKTIVTEFFTEKKMPVPKIDCFFSGDSLLSDTDKKDIVFLDIAMPGLDGIQTGKRLLAENDGLILIIVTAFADYLDDAMRINVFRYISKPIDPPRLKRNLSDAIGSYTIREDKPIVIDTPDGTMRFNSSDIVMLETVGRKIKIYTVNETITTDKSLKEWMTILPDSIFYLCHRSFIVNISHIKKITSDKVIMDKNNLEAYLTQRKHAEIKKKWMIYMETLC